MDNHSAHTDRQTDRQTHAYRSIVILERREAREKIHATKNIGTKQNITKHNITAVTQNRKEIQTKQLIKSDVKLAQSKRV